MRGVQRPSADAEVIAHRGASGYAPEHTFAAYDLALAQGADVLELDVRATADCEPVLVHDPTLLRTTGDPRRVDELSAADVVRLEHPARPVALEAALERYADVAGFLVDLKDPVPAWERRVVEAIERHGLTRRAVIQSFDLAALERLRRAAGPVPVATLYRRADRAAIEVDAVPAFADGIGPWHGVVDAELVDAAHARGLAVRPWTVDEPVEAQRLMDLGVDGIITNTPDRVVPLARPSEALRAAA
jgi:glycerophosphoryl diester phosphodiesterase